MIPQDFEIGEELELTADALLQLPHLAGKRILCAGGSRDPECLAIKVEGKKNMTKMHRIHLKNKSPL